MSLETEFDPDEILEGMLRAQVQRDARSPSAIAAYLVAVMLFGSGVVVGLGLAALID